MYSVLNKLSEYITFTCKKNYFIHFCCTFLKSSKAFSVFISGRKANADGRGRRRKRLQVTISLCCLHSSVRFHGNSRQTLISANFVNEWFLVFNNRLVMEAKVVMQIDLFIFTYNCIISASYLWVGSVFFSSFFMEIYENFRYHVFLKFAYMEHYISSCILCYRFLFEMW